MFDFKSAILTPNDAYPDRVFVQVETSVNVKTIEDSDSTAILLSFMPPFAAAVALESYYHTTYEIVDEPPPVPSPPDPNGDSPEYGGSGWGESYGQDTVWVRTSMVAVGDILDESDREGVLGQVSAEAMADGWGENTDDMYWGDAYMEFSPNGDEVYDPEDGEYKADGTYTEIERPSPIFIVCSVVRDLYERAREYTEGLHSVPGGWKVTARGLVDKDGVYIPGNVTISKRTGNPDEDFIRRYVAAHQAAGKPVTAKQLEEEFGISRGAGRRIIAAQKKALAVRMREGAEEVIKAKEKKRKVQAEPVETIPAWKGDDLSTSERIRLWADAEIKSGKSPSAKTAPSELKMLAADKTIRARISEVRKGKI